MLSSGNVRPLVGMLTGQQVAWLSKHVAEARAQKADWSMELLADYLVGRSQAGHQYDVAFYGSMLQHHEVTLQGPWSSTLQGLRQCAVRGILIQQGSCASLTHRKQMRGSLMEPPIGEPAVLLWQQAAAPCRAAGILLGWVPLGWSPVRGGLLQHYALLPCGEAAILTLGFAVMICAIMLVVFMFLQPLDTRGVLLPAQRHL